MEKKVNEDYVKLLAMSGISFDLCHDHGQEMLFFATENDSPAVASRIVETARWTTDVLTSLPQRQQISILLAAFEGNVEKFRQMMAVKALNLSGDLREVGETRLFIAVEQQNLAMTQTLLHLSVDVNARASSGQSALHRATRHKNVPLIKLLRENNALVDSKDDYRRTPWSANVYLQDNTVLDVLRHAGADPNTKGLQGVSELYAAAKDGKTDLVRFMLESGTDPSIQTNYQWAPLHWAAFYGHTECVRLLIEAGADVSVISDQGVTSLDLAIKGDEPAAVAMLTSAGAKDYKNILFASPTKRMTQLEEDSDPVVTRATEALEQPEHAVLQKEVIATDTTKLRLVYDKPLSRTLKDSLAVGQYVYMAGTSKPSGNIYQVSHLLETQTDCISVRKSPSRAKMWDYPLQPGAFDDKDVLYDIIRSSPDYLNFKLNGQHQDHLPGTFSVSRLLVGDWEVRLDHAQTSTPLLRTMADWSQTTRKECRWTADSGTLLARSGWEDETPVLCLEAGVERAVQDLIVTCWIAERWSETMILHG
ncbi:MAG: hypothetical protein Q9195_008605 [Heterodermia aff. obscurata]